jgi:hypothetical protein
MIHTRLSLAAVVTLGAALIAACGGSATPAIPASAKLLPASGRAAGRIVLSQVGAQRIGVQTAAVRSVPPPPPAPPVKTTVIRHGVRVHVTAAPPAPPTGGPTVIVPYSAVIYDPSGATFVFTSISALDYTEVPISVDYIAGGSAYLFKGPRAGAQVVTVGAEELFGVQTGVLQQT